MWLGAIKEQPTRRRRSRRASHIPLLASSFSFQISVFCFLLSAFCFLPLPPRLRPPSRRIFLQTRVEHRFFPLRQIQIGFDHDTAKFFEPHCAPRGLGGANTPPKPLAGHETNFTCPPPALRMASPSGSPPWPDEKAAAATRPKPFLSGDRHQNKSTLH